MSSVQDRGFDSSTAFTQKILMGKFIRNNIAIIGSNIFRENTKFKTPKNLIPYSCKNFNAEICTKYIRNNMIRLYIFRYNPKFITPTRQNINRWYINTCFGHKIPNFSQQKSRLE